MYCSTCRYSFEATDSSRLSPSANKFCRRCGSRLPNTGEKLPDENPTLSTTQHTALSDSPRRLPFWRTFLAGRHGEPHIFLITMMWALTIASWVCILALEPFYGVVLDIAAVFLALILIFMPPATNRINGWIKISMEAAALTLSLWYH
jgi:hypothetical protein